MPPDDPQPVKPAWRTVHQRQPRRQKLKKEPPTTAPAAGPPAHPPPQPRPDLGPNVDPRRQVNSWATWRRESLEKN
jgi:hypothetical protein